MDSPSYIYAGAAEESHHASVKMLVKNKIVEFKGFDDRLITYRNDVINFNIVVDESELVSGHILIGFANRHAVVFVVISDDDDDDDDEQWLESTEEFTYLLDDDYESKCLPDLYRTHIRYQNKLCEDFILEWGKVSCEETLNTCQRLFYVCKFSDVRFLEIQSVALSALPAYYSTFYSDCLEFCKTFVKNFIATFELDCVRPERIDALTITEMIVSSKLEESSRRDTKSAVKGNRAVDSSTNANIFVFIACVLGVTVGQIIWKLADKFLF